MALKRLLSPAGYTGVCAILILLTILTVCVSFESVAAALKIPVHGVWRIVIGIAIALCKASLVVLFFMHAIVSNRVTWSVIAVVSFWLVLLLALTFSDYVTRGMIPHMPGH
jgi:cytochrome c oxidase subunit IV